MCQLGGLLALSPLPSPAHRESIPTIGFNVEHVEYKNIDMTMWDVGGQTKLRHLW